VRQSDGYRAFLFDADGRLGQRIDLTCVDDDDAMMHLCTVGESVAVTATLVPSLKNLFN
jgi:hypothetical protein